MKLIFFPYTSDKIFMSRLINGKSDILAIGIPAMLKTLGGAT